MDTPRERSSAPSLNFSRDSSIYFDASSQIYADKIEVENVKLNWTK